jgi:hypothetical protein
MNARQQHEIKAASDMSIKDTLKAQRSSYLDEGEASASTWIDRNDRAIDALVRHSEMFSEAINEDFSCRQRQINLVAAMLQKDLPYANTTENSNRVNIKR